MKSSADLLDVNVWVALSSADHARHSRVIDYWYLEAADQLTLCRITALGFLRLSTNSKVMAGKPYTQTEAWQAYKTLRSSPNVVFADEPAGCDSALAALVAESSIPSKIWSDAYLAAFAIAGDMRLVTFDADFAQFPGLQILHLRP